MEIKALEATGDEEVARAAPKRGAVPEKKAAAGGRRGR
jgi:hypothetical protein